LHVIEEDQLVENASKMGEYALSGLREIARTCPFVSEVRGKG
jgi:4-aminobutyrate aminotransferase-like enzyme